MVFSYTEGSTVDTFHVSDFEAFDQSYRLEDAVDHSGSKSSCNLTWITSKYSQNVVLSHVMMHQIISIRLFYACLNDV